MELSRARRKPSVTTAGSPRPAEGGTAERDSEPVSAPSGTWADFWRLASLRGASVVRPTGGVRREARAGPPRAVRRAAVEAEQVAEVGGRVPGVGCMTRARTAAAACASSDYGSGMEPTEDQGPFQPRTPPMAVDDPVVQWLLQGDPAIRWQVLRDLARRRGDRGGDRASAGGARGLGCSAAGAAGS